MPSRTEQLEQEARARRWAQTTKLQKWAAELWALGEMLFNEDEENGWRVPNVRREPQLTVGVVIDGAEFARFVRDEEGIIGVFGDSEPRRFESKEEAFDEAIRRRIARDMHRR